MVLERLRDSAAAASDHWIHVEESPRRVRVVVGGKTIADSRHAMLLREMKSLSGYCFPPNDVRTELMHLTDQRARCPYRDEAL